VGLVVYGHIFTYNGSIGIRFGHFKVEQKGFNRVFKEGQVS
jgi:hypothetical protein